MSKEHNRILIESIIKAVGPLDETATFSPIVVFKNLKGESVAHVSYEVMLEIFEEYLNESNK
jgi:hypothetical protein